MIRVFALILFLATFSSATPLDVRLPTENHHLFTGDLDRFYMYVNRTFEGETSQPWEAGSYGFVRTAIRVGGQVLLTKFHEGIDISPVKRDQAGNPLDLVSSIAAGRVAYVSPISGRSNYGKYVVVEHRWEDSSIYSLYAHLAEITCNPGDTVNAGSVLGRMGYTGAGIDRVRAHLHLEIGMLVSSQFNEWHKKTGAGTNFHGLFNGMNLTSADAARFFVEHKANPALQFSEFIASTPVYFKVTIPFTGVPDFVKRHPWIARDKPADAKFWEISFSATGLPVAFSPSQRQVAEPVLTSVRPSTVPHRYLTRGLVTGEGNRAELTSSGKQLVTLLTENFPVTQ
ncbi:MAG: murein hydrolase activator EnvC family protein [Luteolibacter sp.]